MVCFPLVTYFGSNLTPRAAPNLGMVIHTGMDHTKHLERGRLFIYLHIYLNRRQHDTVSEAWPVRCTTKQSLRTFHVRCGAWTP